MTKGTSLRLIVLEILLEQEKEGGKLNLLVNNVLKRYGYLERTDRAFIKMLTEGTVERRITLDHVIDRFSHVKTAKQKPVIRNILRLSAYQMFFMEHVPDHTVCDEAVKLVKRKHMAPLSGFVNGVLRSMAREKPDIDAIEDVSVRFSCPEWIYERFCEDFGKDKARDIIEYCLGNSPVYIRSNVSAINPDDLKKRLNGSGIEAEEVEGLPFAFRISGFDNINDVPGFSEGLFSVQDLSSMSIGAEIERIVAEKEPDSFYITDVCASPGGKSCHAAEVLTSYAKSRGRDLSLFRVEARDVSEEKAVLINENKERLGLHIINTSVIDARIPADPEEGSEKADLIIADLPCSGLGVMGRKNDLKYRVKPEDIPALQALQREILSSADTFLKEGGYLIFSVCTILHEETEDQSRWIKEALGCEELNDCLFLPGEKMTDGFYYAVFRKTGR